MIRVAAVLFVVVFGFVLNASAQDFKLPEASGRVYFKNVKDGAVVPSALQWISGRLRPDGP